MSEKFLKHIRKEVYNLIPENSSVIDIGCGKGKLLRELSDKINYGWELISIKEKLRVLIKNILIQIIWNLKLLIFQK